MLLFLEPLHEVSTKHQDLIVKDLFFLQDSKYFNLEGITKNKNKNNKIWSK